MSDGRRRIGLREVRALAAGETIWDSAVIGFGARRQKGATVSYFVKYRTREGRQRWETIGRHGSPWTPETARERALQVLGDVAKGGDPATEKRAARRANTVAELCDLYIADAEAGRLLTRRRQAKRSSTVATDKGRIERHIKPLLGSLSVPAVTRDDVERFMHAVKEGRTATRVKTGPRGLARVKGGAGTASRTMGLLGAIFTYAVRKVMRSDNPAHGVVRFADGKRERRLSEQEYAALGAALREAEAAGMWPPAIAAMRFLALTGWRRSEALNLRWTSIDPEQGTAAFTLSLGHRTTRIETKTGPSLRLLSRAACDVLNSVSRRNSTDLVFPSARIDGPMTGFASYWRQIIKLANLPLEITPHVLRHSFGSLAGDLGCTELEIAALLGHAKGSITANYHHSGVLREAAEATANRTAELMGDREAGDGSVIEFSQRRVARS
jgi:integrase